MSLPLWDHQTLAIEKAKCLPHLAILFEPGTGKTRTTIEILRDKFTEAKRVRRTLIFAPLIIVNQWKREFAKFSKIPPDKILPLDKAPARLKAFQKQVALDPDFIAITNYEALLTDPFCQALLEWGPEILVLDESHKVKDVETKRFKKLLPLANVAAHRYILTGTPVLNSLLDIFAQYRILDGGDAFGQKFWYFKSLYFYDANSGMPPHVHFPDWKPKPSAMAHIQKVLAKTAVQAKKEECITLPPLLRQEIPIALGKDQKKAYDMMKAAFIAQVKDKTIAAELVLTQTQKLQQILCGFIHDEKSQALHLGDNPRMDALVELVDSLVPYGQVVIWTNFTATYGAISEALLKRKIQSLHLTGQQTAKEKDDNAEKFKRGEVPVLICNPQAASLGLNLQEAKYMIYYSRSYSLDHDIQSEARCYRAGSEQHDKITRYDLVAEGTLDEEILKALRGKMDLATTVMRWVNE